MRFILLIFGLFLLGESVMGQGKTCHMKELDLCVTNFVYDQKGLPTTDKQFKKSCSSWKHFQKCINTYIKRCSKEPLRYTFELLMDSLSQSFNDLCSKPQGDPARAELYKHAKCLNANQAKISTCRERTKESMFYMIDSGYEKQVPIICCNARQVYDCTYNKTIELCGQEAGDFQKDYYSITQDIVTICKHYDPATQSCEGMNVPDNYKTKIDPKSPVYRMINAVL